MSTVGISLTVPATNTAGAASATGNMQGVKTLVVEEATGVFSGTVIIEARASSGGYCQVASFSRPGSKEIDIPCDEMRVRRGGAGTGTPTVDVSAEEGIVRAAALTVPAAVGVGASTNVSTFGEHISLFVGSPFNGSIEIEGSADDTDFAQVFKSFVGPGCEVKDVPANYLRVRRRGTGTSGTPAVTVAAVSELQSIGLGEVEGLNYAVPTVATATIGAGSCRDSTGATIITTAGTLTATITDAGANGLDTGSEVGNTWYACHIIDGPGATVASLFSLSSTAPTLPAGYTVFRFIGWAFNTSGGDFRLGAAFGLRTREFFYSNNLSGRAVLAGGASTSWTDVVCTGQIAPTSRRAQFVAFQDTAGSVILRVRANGSAAPTGQFEIPPGDAAGTIPRMAFYMDCDAGQIIEYQNSAGGGTSDIFVATYVYDI